jgi:hypothetical protein
MKAISTLSLIMLGFSTLAMEIKMNLNDLISNSHLIVAGTCIQSSSFIDSGHFNIVKTSVQFDNLDVIRTNPGFVDRQNEEVLTITHLGGSTGDKYMTMCGMPSFEVGNRYLLFLLCDGKEYISPLVGSDQGLFMIINDQVTGDEYLLNSALHGVTGVHNLKIIATEKAVATVSQGRPTFIQTQDINKQIGGPIILFGGEVKPDSVTIENDHLLTVNKFRSLVIEHQFTEPSLAQWKRNNKSMPSLPMEPVNIETVPQPSDVSNTRDDILGACGWQQVYIGQEEMPESWDSYDDFAAARSNWDAYGNLFSNSPDNDSTWAPDNGESDMCGWISDNTLYSSYGVYWGTRIAITFSWWLCECCEIVETDLAFNPDFDWVYDFDNAFNTSKINFLNVIIHELGHVWGLATGPQYGHNDPGDYDYDIPSVMHAYYSTIWEDGKEIHWGDAYLYRATYDDQLSLPDVDDVGAESYYASNGLNNCTVSDYSLNNGQSFTYYNVTVENMSDDELQNVHVRFYLSTNKTLTENDYLIGDYYWDKFDAESYSVFDYGLTVTNVPGGTYYLAAKVTINGYNADDRSANDVTWSTFTVSISGNVGIENGPAYTKFLIYPNPADNFLFVAEHPNFDVTHWEIIDQMGHVVETSSSPSQFTNQINVSGLIPGLYNLRICSRFNCEIKKLIVSLN